ncbi:glutathione S-transferase family protein [Vibrio genomosp. F10]|uniref:Glutathione S-transferase n=2 Tax=Vibrio genomosp. F10 TaxID=723171 RepID=A0A1B9QXQ3_9VIBR|nr:glutathione S-transferase family protein [Vibrio genomosp. F10]OCH75016.1 glutathione S-transferase [Vibrio genomosp. F10]OEE31150.1 glutathione S-transferase [Vibrio genomosp. F10 str. ZF-129]OEF03968.1 glutathione S-transferase [Vibrio genomosp. F10 str. 9ZB36]OEF09757.1 glutathione S-transferase [Vibrio genomosp. F10 str. 9ZD137]
MKLIIGNQNYSSWSLRAWLIFAQYDVNIEVSKLKLYTEEFYQKLSGVTPAGKVPVLIDNGVSIWDSLAILEYVNEAFLEGKAWPEDRYLRAQARAISAEMHSGFMSLRSELPMNCRANRKVELSPEAINEIARVEQLWSAQMACYPGGWLFGEWSIADAMYAPLALRFQSYGVELSAQAKQYQIKVLNSSAVKRWLAEANEETEVVKEAER